MSANRNLHKQTVESDEFSFTSEGNDLSKSALGAIKNSLSPVRGDLMQRLKLVLWKRGGLNLFSWAIKRQSFHTHSELKEDNEGLKLNDFRA